MAIFAMSKRARKDAKRQQNSASAGEKANAVKIQENSALKLIIGQGNVKRWNALKESFCHRTNRDFASWLLDLAQDQLNRNPCKEQNQNGDPKKGNKGQACKNGKRKSTEKKKAKEEKTVPNVAVTTETAVAHDMLPITLENEKHKPSAQEPINRQIVETEQMVTTTQNSSIPITSSILESSLVKKENIEPKPNVLNTVSANEVVKEERVKKKKFLLSPDRPLKKPLDAKKKVVVDDIRRAPELNNQAETKIEPAKSEYPAEPEDAKIKQCQNCGTKHPPDHCPLHYPNFIICDSVSLAEWQDRYQSLHLEHSESCLERENEQKDDDKDKFAYSKMSLPNFLDLFETSTDHGVGVAANIDIQAFTQFGPLMGRAVKEVDISEDSTMRDMWEIPLEAGNLYLSTESVEASNWIRYLRPAAVREERNVAVVTKDSCLFFITIKAIKGEEELVFWQDSAVATNKKKMEKTSCGGCNMTFAHPLYYRTHCSVFHDVRYSLTIRKYHCKVCGAAVLGKENIMKHAAELHNGQGAYQCQFCKKFFLRLNYLEMHRTYGCSANPHRSRPLCDFCGRKFCQPQKLKVHIKRMHSDFADVLKEFQCKSCLKILGSRAALQRHLKEVHQKQLDVTCSCSRCGKHFQNKSNLKIHMLTHSGIKPFRCIVKTCNAAFTTKQCLQFHYKKVHNFTKDCMPKIERSIDYTFEAYSGDPDDRRDEAGNMQQNDSTAATFDGESDLDENSLDSKNMDDTLEEQSPLQVVDQGSPEPAPRHSPQPLDTYNMNATVNVTMKILSKGSKKWIGDQPLLKPDNIYHMDSRLGKDDLGANVTSLVQEAQNYERVKLGTNLSDFTRHEASNASLLVEAALDSVCSEPNVDIDVGSASNCTDALVSNLYTLAPPDSLQDVGYNETVCMNDNRDINLISPSVNDHISVTDELNEELRHNHNIGMEYSGFHQEAFSPGNSPEMHHRSSFVRNYINTLSPPQSQSYMQKSVSPVPVPSPPRYDFGHAVNADHLSSDDSNGMAAQNLSLHSKHNDIQLDLSIYKSPYKLDSSSFHARKDFRSMKFDDEIDPHGDSGPLDGDHVDSVNQNDIDIHVADMKDKEAEENERVVSDIRTKFDLDLDLRIKNYDLDAEALRARGLYESSADLDFRSKAYDLVDKAYDPATIESDFRTDRNFEPLVLNSSELQGLDMSARSFHNYPNINRYHHLYSDVDRVDLRLNYSPPTPSYTHADLLRVVSLDLTPPGRHSVDLSLRSHPLHQIANSRLLSDHGLQANPHRLLDQSRLLGSDLSTARHLTGLGEAGGRILSDHTTNRILSNSDQLSTNHLLSSEQRLLTADDSRMISDQPRLLEQSRLLGDGRILQPATPSGTVSPVPAFTGYSVSQTPYHPTPLAPRPHVTSPTPTPYHHYSTYY